MRARGVAFAFVLACAGFSTVGSAQTLTGVEPAPSPPPNNRTDQLGAINYTDCVKNRVLNFTVRVTGVGATIDVRTGTNCVDMNGKVNTTDCGSVTTLSVSNTIVIGIDSAAVVAADRRVALSDGGSTCLDNLVNTEPRTVKLNFMLIDNSSTVMTVFTNDVVVDLLGPPAPKSLKAGVGEQRLILDWERPATQDISSYNFYCAPASSAAGSGGSPQAAGAAGSLGTGGLVGMGGGAGAGAVGGVIDDAGTSTDDASTGGAAGVGLPGSGGATADASSGDGQSASASCSTALTPNAVPPVDLPTCGGASDSVASGEARPLQNGVQYAVGVAAVDALGNAGPLSNVACATPQEVDDFFETYRNAGGGAGGGFCALGARPAPGAAALLVVGLLVRRLRRRTAREKKLAQGARS